MPLKEYAIPILFLGFCGLVLLFAKHGNGSETANRPLGFLKIARESLLLLAVFLTSVLLLHGALPPRQQVGPGSAKVYRHIDRTLDAFTAIAQDKKLIIVSGGSYTARALDPDMLSSLLSTPDKAVTVLSIARTGQNHLERKPILEYIEAAILERGIPAKQVTFLNEVHQGYDSHPFVQLRSLNARTIEYCSLGNTLPVLLSDDNKAWRSFRENPDRFWTYVSALFLNAFNVAYAQLDDDAAQVSFTGYAPEQGPNRDFVFRQDQLKEALEANGNTAEENLDAQWLMRHTYWPYAKEGLVYGRVVNFIPPSLRPSYYHYYAAFAGHNGHAHLSFEGYIETLRRLDQARYWYDKGHVTRYGAEIITRWVAQELQTLGVI